VNGAMAMATTIVQVRKFKKKHQPNQIIYLHLTGLGDSFSSIIWERMKQLMGFAPECLNGLCLNESKSKNSINV
jgi:hypothetical protein